MRPWDPAMQVTWEEFEYISKGMVEAGSSNLFAEMFQSEPSPPQCGMTREKLLVSINPQMKLTRNFFMQIYGYDISTPGFAEETLQALENAGSTRSRAYYDTFVAEYEGKQAESLKPVAERYIEELNKEWERKVGEEQRIQKRMLEILQSK